MTNKLKSWNKEQIKKEINQQNKPTKTNRRRTKKETIKQIKESQDFSLHEKISVRKQRQNETEIKQWTMKEQ